MLGKYRLFVWRQKSDNEVRIVRAFGVKEFVRLEKKSGCAVGCIAMVRLVGKRNVAIAKTEQGGEVSGFAGRSA